jgi:hypothetical protein
MRGGAKTLMANATAAYIVPPTPKYKQARRLSCSRRERQKPLYQAAFAPAPTSRRVETVYADCIKDGVFIEIMTTRLIQFNFASDWRFQGGAKLLEGVQARKPQHIPHFSQVA